MTLPRIWPTPSTTSPTLGTDGEGLGPEVEPPPVRASVSPCVRVWTGSLDRAIRVVKGVRAGKMFVNCYNSSGIDNMPHGGSKMSGFGREFGQQGLLEFQELKTVQIKLSI